MNERYTYGYNVGWNVENEYINSLNGILENYNNQTKKINDISEEINDLKKFLNGEIPKPNGRQVSDEQMREWYEEDYSFNNRLYTFEAYKKDILEMLDKENEKIRLEYEQKVEELNQKKEQARITISTKENESVANIYYLIKIKDETRKEILKRKNELNLLLSEKEIQLSSILLEQQKNGTKYDANGNIINSEELRNLQQKYDEMWLEIRKIEHALKKLDEMYKLIEYTKEEYDLMMRGLNPRQKEIYNTIINPVPPKKSDVEEYNNLLEMYNEDLDRLYELQAKYENGEIEYLQYKEHADYMVERYNYIMQKYQEQLSIGREPIKPEQPMMILEKIGTIPPGPTSEDDYDALLEMYNEDLDGLYELQAKYENGEIEYLQYKEHADYMTERYNYIMQKYQEQLSIGREPIKPEQPMMILEKIGTIPPGPTSEDDYDALLEMYNEDLDRLYELQAKYENGEIEYSQYKEHADYMTERYNYIMQKYQEQLSIGREPIKPEQPMMILENKIIEEPGEDKNEKSTLEEIIYKICGDKEFNDSQSSRYAASKIKVFSKPQKNNLGLAYKIVSIPRTVIGIIPRAAMKLYGMFITKETKNIFAEMEKRANELTDKEVEILLNEYKGARAQAFRLPKGFNDAVRPRVNLYVSKKVANINKKIQEDLLTINYCEKVIVALKNKLATETSPEMKEKINEVLANAYGRAYYHIKDLIELQVQGNNLQNGNGLHSFEEELKALDTKLNYVGGRFSKTREYSPKLMVEISEYSHKIENSTDPIEVVEAFVAREKIYKENSKEKRSILNLGSKVSAGKLDYRPFVESLNYGNDPFIRDLITSILVVSSAVSLVNNISTNIANRAAQEAAERELAEKISEHNKAIENYNASIAEHNARITEHNASIAEHNANLSSQQEIIQQIRDNGGTIEKGIIYDVRKTEGAIENLAERGINDKYGWNLSSSSYKAEDAAHHLETANLTVNNTNAILELSNKYSSGTITHAQYLKGLRDLQEQTTGVYENYVRSLTGDIEAYAQSHPQFDYSAVLSALKHAANNPSSSVELTDFLTELYEKSIDVTDLESLEVLDTALLAPSVSVQALSNAVVSSHSLTPDILTLGSAAAKATQEQFDSDREVKPDSKRSQEIRETIENLRAMKAELSKEEVEEIESLLR